MDEVSSLFERFLRSYQRNEVIFEEGNQTGLAGQWSNWALLPFHRSHPKQKEANRVLWDFLPRYKIRSLLFLLRNLAQPSVNLSRNLFLMRYSASSILYDGFRQRGVFWRA